MRAVIVVLNGPSSFDTLRMMMGGDFGGGGVGRETYISEHAHPLKVIAPSIM